MEVLAGDLMWMVMICTISANERFVGFRAMALADEYRATFPLLGLKS